jgi:solute carrier family 6 GABA transporter-like protein 1
MTGGFNTRLRGVGVSSVICGFMLNSYYVVLIAWVVNAFFDSFTDNGPWGDPDLSGKDAISYFYNDIIGMSTVTDPDLRPSRIVGKNVGYTALVWSIVYIIMSCGLKWTGRITYFTMGLPLVLLFVFLGGGAGLPGSGDGIKA